MQHASGLPLDLLLAPDRSGVHVHLTPQVWHAARVRDRAVGRRIDNFRQRRKTAPMARTYKTKAAGIVRNIDHLGRVVVPVEMRRALGLEPNSPVEILLAQDSLQIRPHRQGCIFCGSTNGIREHKGKVVYDGCRDALAAPPGATT